VRRLAAAAVAVCVLSTALEAQSVDGYASVLFDALPDLGMSELRTRLQAGYRRELGPRIRLVASGFVEGLLADRNTGDLVRAAIVRPQELNLEAAWEHADVRAGFSRVAWGRLDEFLPTDVVNPQDLAKFFFEGRTEGRMSVAMVRARWLPSDRFALESIYVPFFRSGSFDELNEETSPFAVRLPFPIQEVEPARTFGNAQGGLRATATSGRVDWSLSAYRGFEPLPVYDGWLARFPRFTMIGGDFETVRGEWGVRGEVAVFVDRTLQLDNASSTVEGKSIEAGVGADRKAGAYRVSGNLILTSRIVNVVGADRNEVTIVASLDRSFARETRNLRVFAAYNPGEQTAFGRVIGGFSLRDNLLLEASGGVFAGSGRDVFARFADRDFLYLRLKAFF
jgi:hypothetical protein